MELPNTETQQPDEIAAAQQEIQHVPTWVKGIVAAGAILFAIQMLDFKSSLSDAIEKNRAAMADRAGQYAKAISLYKDLRVRYPEDNNLKKELGFVQYRAGLYAEALQTFNLLAGVKMPKAEVNKINAAISDSAAKLNLTIK
jgi:tetratricopeptide (TPR) repeat protein